MFENGILDLSNLDAMNESAEFAPNSYATKDVSNHVQDAKVSIPAGTTMTTQAYEEMLKSFQNSFKEAADFIGAIKNVRIVDSDPVEQLMENAIDEALMNVFDNGPVFEAVDRDDKKKVQGIVSKVRKSIKSLLAKNDISFYEPNKIARILIGAGVGALSGGATGGVPGMIGGAAGGAVSKFWGQRLWQIVGVCHLEEANIDALTKILMDEYGDDIGEYKFITVKTVSTLGDLFRNNFGWKNSKNTYFILIDKKLPAEIKKFQDEAAAAIKAGDEHGVTKDDKKKDDGKKNVNESTDLYQMYLQKFTESGVLGKPLSQEEFVESMMSKLK